MTDVTNTPQEPVEPPDPSLGIYYEGQDLPPAYQRGHDPATLPPRPANLDRRGRPLPNHSEQYQWPTYPAYEAGGRFPCLPALTLPGTEGEYVSHRPAEGEPTNVVEAGTAAMPPRT